MYRAYCAPRSYSVCICHYHLIRESRLTYLQSSLLLPFILVFSTWIPTHTWHLLLNSLSLARWDETMVSVPSQSHAPTRCEKSSPSPCKRQEDLFALSPGRQGRTISNRVSYSIAFLAGFFPATRARRLSLLNSKEASLCTRLGGGHPRMTLCSPEHMLVRIFSASVHSQLSPVSC